ncbi:MAG: FGGY family carbohydrate kinase [Propioniciclava sp.]
MTKVHQVRGRFSQGFSLGVDIGTSAVKATLLGAGGTETFVSSPYPLDAPAPGYAEQNPDHWWAAVGEVLDAVFERYPDVSGENTILGLTGQMHTSVLRDADGRILRPAILWCDARSSPQCARLADSGDDWVGITGYRPLPAFTSAHLAWVAEHQPDLLRKAATVAVPKDDIRRRLGAGWFTEPSDASAMNLMDNATDRWSEPLIARTGARPEMFAPIVPSAAVTGVVCRTPPMRHADRLRGARVIGGSADQAAQAIALGADRPGRLAISVGTSGAVFQAVRTPQPGAFRHARPGLWMALDAMHAAGLAIAWWAELVGLDYGAFPHHVPALDAPTFLPYLQGTRHGGGAPGTLSDLTAAHTTSDIAGAVVEGVAIELYRLAERLTDDPLVPGPVGVGGRAAGLPALRATLAVALGRRVAHTPNGPSYGAALLAGEAAGWSNADDPGGATATVTDPDPGLRQRFEQRLARYQDLVGLLDRPR